jgi:DNA-binding protein Fis
MKQRGIQDSIKDNLEKYFSDLNGESSNGVFKMVTQQAESATIKFVLTKSIKIKAKLRESLV